MRSLTRSTARSRCAMEWWRPMFTGGRREPMIIRTRGWMPRGGHQHERRRDSPQRPPTARHRAGRARRSPHPPPPGRAVGARSRARHRLDGGGARHLGIDRVGKGVQVWITDRWYTVVGILNPVTLAPELDSYAMVGLPYAERALGADDSPSYIYARAKPDSVTQVSSILGPTANPEHPEEVDVSRPSDALEARAKAKTAFTSLFLGLGAAVLIGALAGLYPAMRGARVSPTTALRTA